MRLKWIGARKKTWRRDIKKRGYEGGAGKGGRDRDDMGQADKRGREKTEKERSAVILEKGIKR